MSNKMLKRKQKIMMLTLLNIMLLPKEKTLSKKLNPIIHCLHNLQGHDKHFQFLYSLRLSTSFISIMSSHIFGPRDLILHVKEGFNIETSV